MSHYTRREFIKQTGFGLAAAVVLRPTGALGSAGKSTVEIPPHQAMVVPAVHGYAAQSVAAGEKIQFCLSSTVPYQLSIYRLGLDPESPDEDTLLHQFSQSEARPQAIHPGSYIHVPNPIQGSFKGLTLECWARPWKLKNWAGVMTQFDNKSGGEFGLFIGPGGAVSFCLGDGMKPDNLKLQLSGKTGVRENVWHHLVAVWDGRNRQIFINGRSVGQWRFTGKVAAGKIPLRLAASGEAGLASAFFDGDLAMPVIYDRALAPEEISERAQQLGLILPKGKNILAAWSFAEEKGDRVADISGQRRHGTIINQATWMIGGPSFDHKVARFTDYHPSTDERRGHGLRFASDALYDCRWEPTHEYRIPPDARSGLYVGRVFYKWEGQPHLYHITFVVRKPARRKKAPILVLAATNTWRAYNSAPFPKPMAALKKNCTTNGMANSPGDPPAPSFYRHHAGGQGCYQIGLNMPWPGSDPYLMYGKEYSHLARADRFAHVWLEKAGYKYDLISDLDLHRDPEILSGYRTVIINGHSEYWSLPACFGLEKYLRHGGNAIILSGNTMFWRVSFNADCSIIECRKVDAGGEQMKPPDRGEAWHSQDGLRGGLYRENGYPGYKIVGLDIFGRAGEACFGPYIVEQPDHFLYHHPEETGLKAGDTLGAGPDRTMPRANGHEVDIRPSTFAALQEQPTPDGAVMPTDPPGMTRIANGVILWSKGPSLAHDYFTRPIKPKTPQGGEMIYWERPDGGKVFNTGSIASGWAIHGDPKFQTLMRNVLAHFGVTAQT